MRLKEAKSATLNLLVKIPFIRTMILAHADSDFDADACLKGVLPSACLLSTVYIFLNQFAFDLSFISLNDGVDWYERRLWHPRGGAHSDLFVKGLSAERRQF